MDYKRAAVILEKRKRMIVMSMVITVVLVFGIMHLTPLRWQTAVRINTPINALLAKAINKKQDLPDVDGRSMAAVFSSIARSQEVLQHASSISYVKPPMHSLFDQVETD